MQWIGKLSLRRKLTLVIMFSTAVALCTAGIGFAEYGVYRFKELRLEDLNALANILGTNSTAPLAFKDPDSAQDILKALAAKPHILSAVIYDRDGKPFAIYHRDLALDRHFVPPVEGDSSRFTSNRVLIFQKIVFDGEKLGTVFLEGDTLEYKQLLVGYLFFFALVTAVVSIGIYAMAGRLQRPISHPILELAWTTKMVTSTRDYSIRARKKSEDEVGVLIDGFNEMLAQIQNRDGELSQARLTLERRVDERTIELEQEIADRQRAQEALRESEGRIRLLLDSTAEAIFGIDREGRCTFCNPATLRLLGYEKGENLLGKFAHDLMHHSRADGTPYPINECRIVQSRRTGEGVHLDDEVFWRSDGTSFPVEFWAYPIRKEGEVVGAVITFLDITERKRVEAALREAKDAAEAGSRAKSDFLANMSHEIRTPMNGIIGMTELALDTNLTFEQRDYLSLVKSSADSLLHVINDILDFSKIEAGKLEMEEIGFEIRDLFRDTLKALAQRADRKPIELCVRVSPRVPKVLVGDPIRLRQLVVNLVGNAFKFTEQGMIIVDAEIESMTGDDVRLQISVSDTGIGIPLEKQQIIFESFAQVDGSTTRRFGGTGLGLTISRQLVELMGGRMWLESELGKGSRFHFTCNFRQETKAMSPLECIAAQALPGLNVLIVDNNAVNRGILSEMISNWRMKPTAADNGAVALDLLEAAQIAGHPFSIMLLDAMMPELDGFEVLRRIQPKHGLLGAIVMLLSGDHRLADSEQCRQLGVKHSLMKPVGQSELLDAILAALGLAAAEKQFIGPIPSTPEKPLGRSLHILLAEDNPVNQKLAIRLLEKAGHRVNLACTGREALEAWENSGTARFDVVLMDIQMPEMDGLEATAGIRNREKGSGNHIPILAMTAHAMRGDKEKCLASGMDGYVSKPIRPAELFAEIDKWVTAPQGSATVQDTSLQNDKKSLEQIDRLSLFERVDGDHQLLAEMIHLFQEEAPHLLSVMRGALQCGDMLVLERAAHSLKGAAGNLSAQATVAAALQVEKAAANNDLKSTTENLGTLERAVEHLLPALAELRQGVTK
jgi:two-component system, sensor histidine kinase and response regulator